MRTVKGLFDIHLHGIASADTTATNVDAIIGIARYQQIHGIENILLSVYPDAVKTMRSNMEVIRRAMETVNAKKPGCCARIAGILLEGPFLNPERAGSLNRKHFLPPTIANLRALIKGNEDIIRMLTIAPELPGALKVIRASRDAGITVSMGHSDATFREAAAGKKAGATGITHLFNAMRPFHHREPGLAGFGLLDEDIYVEVIADGVHLDLDALRLVFSVKRPDRIILISDAVMGRRAKDGAVYMSGRLAGSGVTLKDEIAYLVKNGFSKSVVLKAASSNPKRFLSL